MWIDLIAFAFFQDASTVAGRVWYYLSYPFTFGRITVTPASLALGLIVLALTFPLARAGSSLIERRLARLRNIDPGLRYTIARVFKYLAITFGVLLSLKQAFPIDLTSIAVVFTALSVGIGFGLQYIAADIASGFILLFERPIRVGDRITIADDEGDVHSINLRTTIVLTNNGIAIIVPNSKLVTQRVVNWSYGDPRARIPILASVSDDSDVEAVTSALLDAARDVENVLDVPEPKVQFLGFGTSSLDFRLLVWTSQPRRHIQIRSDINYRISSLFHSRGIRIPTPKQELFVRSVDVEHLERDLVAEGVRGESRR